MYIEVTSPTHIRRVDDMDLGKKIPHQTVFIVKFGDSILENLLVDILGVYVKNVASYFSVSE